MLNCSSRVWLSATLWTVARQASLSMGFSRQEYWSGLPSPSPGDLPDPGVKPRSPTLQADALTSAPPGKHSSIPQITWIFIGRTNAKAETPILWPPDVKSHLIGKDLDAEKDSRREEKGTTEDERVGYHHRLNGHEFEKTPGNSEGWGSLACCSPWNHKELDMA